MHDRVLNHVLTAFQIQTSVTYMDTSQLSTAHCTDIAFKDSLVPEDPEHRLEID